MKFILNITITVWTTAFVSLYPILSIRRLCREHLIDAKHLRNLATSKAFTYDSTDTFVYTYNDNYLFSVHLVLHICEHWSFNLFVNIHQHNLTLPTNWCSQTWVSRTESTWAICSHFPQFVQLSILKLTIKDILHYFAKTFSKSSARDLADVLKLASWVSKHSEINSYCYQLYLSDVYTMR